MLKFLSRLEVAGVSMPRILCWKGQPAPGNLHGVFRILGRLKAARFDLFDEPDTATGKTNFMDLTSVSGYALLDLRWCFELAFSC